MRNDRLLLFTRYPTPGSTKTRLIPRLGPEGAADMQEWLTGRSVMAGTLWSSLTGGSLEIHTTGHSEKSFRRWLGRERSFFPQCEGDLGDRLSTAAIQAFTNGAERVCLIGIDCPSLGPEQLKEAFDHLEEHDLSLIPATDGGYVLIGMKRVHPELFTDMSWGTETVLATTLTRAAHLGLKVWQGTPMQDIDLPEDLEHLPAWRKKSSGLSVIIPAYNEQDNIVQAIESASPGAHDIVVVDGGSQDETVHRAASAGATVRTGVTGRGPQQNLGAWHAEGDTLLFVHADSRLPKGYADEVEHILSRPGVGLGAFSLAIEGEHPGLRWVERGAKLRSKIRKRPYGDQSLFIRRDLFERLSGFPAVPLLEDLELVQRVKTRRQVAVSPLPNHCSARRWETNGILRTTLRNQKILAAYALGISPTRLAEWYYGSSST